MQLKLRQHIYTAFPEFCTVAHSQLPKEILDQLESRAKTPPKKQEVFKFFPLKTKEGQTWFALSRLVDVAHDLIGRMGNYVSHSVIMEEKYLDSIDWDVGTLADMVPFLKSRYNEKEKNDNYPLIEVSVSPVDLKTRLSELLELLGKEQMIFVLISLLRAMHARRPMLLHSDKITDVKHIGMIFSALPVAYFKSASFSTFEVEAKDNVRNYSLVLLSPGVTIQPWQIGQQLEYRNLKAPIQHISLTGSGFIPFMHNMLLKEDYNDYFKLREFLGKEVDLPLETISDTGLLDVLVDYYKNLDKFDKNHLKIIEKLMPFQNWWKMEKNNRKLAEDMEFFSQNDRAPLDDKVKLCKLWSMLYTCSVPDSPNQEYCSFVTNLISHILTEDPSKILQAVECLKSLNSDIAEGLISLMEPKTQGFWIIKKGNIIEKKSKTYNFGNKNNNVKWVDSHWKIYIKAITEFASLIKTKDKIWSMWELVNFLVNIKDKEYLMPEDKELYKALVACCLALVNSSEDEAFRKNLYTDMLDAFMNKRLEGIYTNLVAGDPLGWWEIEEKRPDWRNRLKESLRILSSDIEHIIIQFRKHYYDSGIVGPPARFFSTVYLNGNNQWKQLIVERVLFDIHRGLLPAHITLIEEMEKVMPKDNKIPELYLLKELQELKSSMENPQSRERLDMKLPYFVKYYGEKPSNVNLAFFYDLLLNRAFEEALERLPILWIYLQKDEGNHGDKLYKDMKAEVAGRIKELQTGSLLSQITRVAGKSISGNDISDVMVEFAVAAGKRPGRIEDFIGLLNALLRENINIQSIGKKLDKRIDAMTRAAWDKKLKNEKNINKFWS
jgi:hypothetical protein